MLEIEQIFIKILNMSLNASFVVIAVLFLRLLFKKLPKKYSYVLWLIVFLRFLWPFTLESMVSLIPITSEPITQERLTDVTSKVRSERPIDSSTVTKQVDTYNSSYKDAQSNTIAYVDVDISNTPNYVEIASLIWLGIGLLLFTVSVVRLIKLKMKLSTATLINEQYDRVYETDQIISPFIIGIIKP
jgi:beta-lactamase regulating signal transducer with metallopeptidase domain